MSKLDHPWFKQWWTLWLRIGTTYSLRLSTSISMFNAVQED